jgi:hypothetical protein
MNVLERRHNEETNAVSTHYYEKRAYQKNKVLMQENVNCNVCNGSFSSSVVKHTRYKTMKFNVHSDFNKKCD